MRVHSLEHAAFEGPGRIADWVTARGHTLNRTALYAGEPLPAMESFDLLVVMGGTMNIYQHRDFPWLPREKNFLRAAIEGAKPILGVCLGAQLLADVLGGKVYQNPEKEIGWFPIRVTDRTAPFAGFPESMTVMHWHGDTFEIPPGARRVAESEGCPNQAFVQGERVVGIQFHLELDPAGVSELSAESASELVPGRYIQTREQLLHGPPDTEQSRLALWTLLDALAERKPDK